MDGNRRYCTSNVYRTHCEQQKNEITTPAPSHIQADAHPKSNCVVSHLAHRYYHPRVEDAGDCFTIVNTTDALQTRGGPDSHAAIARDRPSRCGGCGRALDARLQSAPTAGPRATVTVAAAPVVRDRLIANSRSSRCGGCGRALDARLESAPTAGLRATVTVEESCVGHVLALRWL